MSSRMFQSRWRFWVGVNAEEEKGRMPFDPFQSRWRFWVGVNQSLRTQEESLRAVSIALAILGWGEPARSALYKNGPAVSIALAILGWGEPSYVQV